WGFHGGVSFDVQLFNRTLSRVGFVPHHYFHVVFGDARLCPDAGRGGKGAGFHPLHSDRKGRHPVERTEWTRSCSGGVARFSRLSVPLLRETGPRFRGACA